MILHYNKPFILKRGIGNNKFSFYKRKLYKEITVSSMEKSNSIYIMESDSIAFAEIEDNIENGFKGISPFLHKNIRNRNIYVFDNHNHAFFFIYRDIFNKIIPSGIDMIHIDQHKDTRIPDETFSEVKKQNKKIKDFLMEIDYLNKNDLKYKITLLDVAFYYTNAVLNVGNFIKPLQNENLIGDLYIVDSTYSLDNIELQANKSEAYILDIDLDFFSEEMDYIDINKKFDVINKLAKNASLITICTSPFFIDFEKAKDALSKINLE